jgi:hypothetical protein
MPKPSEKCHVTLAPIGQVSGSRDSIDGRFCRRASVLRSGERYRYSSARMTWREHIENGRDTPLNLFLLCITYSSSSVTVLPVCQCAYARFGSEQRHPSVRRTFLFLLDRPTRYTQESNLIYR